MDIKKMLTSIAGGMTKIEPETPPIPELIRGILERDGFPAYDIDKLFKLESLVILQFMKIGTLLEIFEAARSKPSITVVQTKETP